MATITYKCNTCDREIELVENQQGLTTFSKCIITSGCNGKLNATSRNPDNFRDVFPANVPGLQDYTQRKALVSFTQSILSNNWTINHNMGVSPAVVVFVYNATGVLTRLEAGQFTVTVVDSNNIQILFPSPVIGEAQLLARSSVNSPALSPLSPNTSFQVTTNGYFVFAVPKLLTQFTYPPTNLPPPTLPDDLQRASIRIEVAIQMPNVEEVVCTEFLSDGLINTPWNGWNEVLVRRRRNYYLFGKSVLTFRSFGGTGLTFDEIPDGTTLSITRIDYGTGVLQPIPNEGLLILLSNSPYTPNDKVINQVIDVGDMIDNVNSTFSYSSTDFFVNTAVPEQTYPNILRVK